MKLRQGFVSNSSSSSFVIAKTYMKKNQIKKFSEFLLNREDSYSETSIVETDHYFQGYLSYHDAEILRYLEEIGVDTNYISLGD